MTYRIDLSLSCFAPSIVMEIFVPSDFDPEEYIDELLDSMLTDEFRYNCDWEFC